MIWTRFLNEQRRFKMEKEIKVILTFNLKTKQNDFNWKPHLCGNLTVLTWGLSEYGGVPAEQRANSASLCQAGQIVHMCRLGPNLTKWGELVTRIMSTIRFLTYHYFPPWNIFSLRAENVLSFFYFVLIVNAYLDTWHIASNACWLLKGVKIWLRGKYSQRWNYGPFKVSRVNIWLNTFLIFKVFQDSVEWLSRSLLNKRK